MKKKILLVGYYGFGNLGDEILLETYLTQLQPKHEVSVLLPKNSFDVAHSVNRWSPWEILRTMAKTDILLFGGGGIFQDQTGSLGLLYYLSLILLARFFGKKIVLLGQGIGPLSPINLRISRTFLRMADHITVRDQTSLEYLSGLEVSESADSAFFWNSEILPLENKPDSQPRIIFIPRSHPKLTREFCEILCRFSEKQGASLEVLPFQIIIEEPMINRLKNIFLDRAKFCFWKKPREAIKTLQGAHLVLSMRLHGLIFASTMGIASTNIFNNPKTDAWERKLGLSFLSEKKPLVEFLNQVWEQKNKIREATSQKLPDFRTQVTHDFERLNTLL